MGGRHVTGRHCSSELPQRALGTPCCYCIRLQDIIVAFPLSPLYNPMRHAKPTDSSSYAEVVGGWGVHSFPDSSLNWCCIHCPISLSSVICCKGGWVGLRADFEMLLKEIIPVPLKNLISFVERSQSLHLLHCSVPSTFQCISDRFKQRGYKRTLHFVYIRVVQAAVR